MKTLTLLLAATGLGLALYRLAQPLRAAAAGPARGTPPRLGLDKLVLRNAGSSPDANADHEDLLATPSKLIG